MPTLPLGRSAYERTRGSFPRLPVVNFIAEKAPTEEGGIAFQSRRGLSLSTTIGSGPVRAIFQRDGVLSGSRFTVSGPSVYVNAAILGALGGSGPISIAGNATQVIITAGASMVHWNGTTFSTVSFPDGAGVTAVAFLAGYFLAIRAGTQRVYFSALNNGASWDGLDYFAAENQPDQALDLVIANDILVIVGSDSTEFWAKTGNADLPFQAIQQRVFQIGAIATGCAVEADNTHFQIAKDGIVYRAGNVPEPISDDGHTADILASATRSLFLVEDERHKLLHVRLATKTLVFDVTSGNPSEFASLGRTNYRASCSDGTYMGDDTDGSIWVFSGYADAGGPMERRISAGFPINGGSISIDNLRLRVEVGQATDLTGDYIEPTIEMRMSDDFGKTWTEWEGESVGAQGDYRIMPEWRALGMADYPGAIFEFRMTDPVGLRFSQALINEAGGGRGR
jgi:hypothetical protein